MLTSTDVSVDGNPALLAPSHRQRALTPTASNKAPDASKTLHAVHAHRTFAHTRARSIPLLLRTRCFASWFTWCLCMLCVHLTRKVHTNRIIIEPRCEQASGGMHVSVYTTLGDDTGTHHYTKVVYINTCLLSLCCTIRTCMRCILGTEPR